ncbi:Rcs stress response system protein RcsF [Xenorhabdus sp. Reich]|uniref:Outer membrane lipoprotein RcsF n=1 Tax=Xenorhabdus littoralis TaxID=2582835 RepID=A0ABU4SRH0_9GAMM|nr:MULTISPECIES: Rcs stress response system protein RcsF [unclassified Xenorhabdus]MDX7991902.1 Rcs stress response system protein RcsF [Xenorhabdus sp. psl]MDX8001161.1 Rcs stress response system protein RcsF [Xenorhabdus sp. Reich]
MRVLPICFMALFMVGCTSLSNKANMPDAELKHPSAKVSSYVRLYTKTDELLDSPFKDLGIVAGESCRSTLQDPPASIATARQKMLVRAAALNANAVLLHQCAILSGQGCYQTAICEGSALLTTNK